MTDEELAQLQQLMMAGAKQIETRLAESLNGAIESINAKVDKNAGKMSELQKTAGNALTNLPGVIKEVVESQLTGSMEEIRQGISAQVQSLIGGLKGGSNGGGAGGGAGGAAAGGLQLGDLLQHSGKIVEMIQAFRAPSTEQAMMGQMGLIFRWHGLLSKLEKGGGSGEDVTQAIADTFGGGEASEEK